MNTVRTRFAPSPTGYVHLGSVRTALYNYLFARKMGGQYLLRIEDTDQTRYVENAVENLLSVLKKMGIEHDEGPDKGGPHASYYQSQRLNLYQEKVKLLLQSGHAYPCFCSAKRLEEMRAKQAETNQDPKYDGLCRTLDPAEASQRIQTESHVIRLKIPSGNIVVEDLIRGNIDFDLSTIDEQVLFKSDGFPTYHLANVVDDHEMQITHVIRGEEWLTSTPKHLLLYRAFGWQPPKFAHLPLLLNPDRSKLSKRQGDVAVEDFLQKGYCEEAMLNFLALLGWHPKDEKEIFNLEELIQEFSLDRINKAGAVFDQEKLNWMNAHYFKQILSQERYLGLLETHIPIELKEKFNAEQIHLILLSLRQAIQKPQDLAELTKPFLLEPDQFDLTSDEAKEVLYIASNRLLLESLITSLQNSDEWSLESWKNTVKEVQKMTQIKGKDLFMPLRLSLSGLVHGPDLAVLVSVLSKNQVIERLRHTLRQLT